MPKLKLLTAAEFYAITPKLKTSLTASLEKERTDTALPKTFGGSPTFDLWELPPVDSKSVAKLSPLVKELIGRRLDPRWIRKGGYESVEAAVDDLIAQLRMHCIDTASPVAKSDSPVPTH